MSKSSAFLATSNIAGHEAVRVGDRLLLADHVNFRAALGERSPELARFLAEPLFAGGQPNELGNVSWYSSFDRAGRRLAELSDLQLERLRQNLRERLAEAFTLIDDPELGESVRAMMIVPSRDSVRVVGIEPVLIEWAVAPKGLGDGTEARIAHFNAIFGPLCGVEWPPAKDADTVSDAISTDTQSPLVPGPNPPMLGAVAQATPDGLSPPSPPALEMQADGLDVGPDAAQTDLGSEDTPSTAKRASKMAPGTRWYRHRSVGVALAVVLVLAILLLLWWLLFGPGGMLARGTSLAGLSHNAVLEGLESERDRLRGLESLECGPELIESVRDGFTGPVMPPPASGVAEGSQGPPPHAQSDGIAPGSQGVVSGSSLTALAQSLERSVVFVVGPTPDGIGLGSGFFVSQDTLVTNRHVVESMDPTRVMITSQFLGAVRPARIVVMTDGFEIGHPDFAVLRIDGHGLEGAIPLSIASSAPKLAPVVAAGYPGFIAQTDPQLDALLGGDSRAAPAMVFTRGEVSVVQGQRSGVEIIIHTADMSPGNSGGPLVDTCGRVAGVNTFIGTDEVSGRRGLYALSGNGLMGFLEAKGLTFSRADTVCIEGGGAPPSGE